MQVLDLETLSAFKGEFMPLSVLLFFSKAQTTPQTCGENEIWKECVSSSCAEGTCEKPVPGPACTADCSYGCYCADSFYRHQGRCISLEECPGH
ncbi:hypothetical protein HPB49_011908 [Dermacentor silvarum]|uniref:Uncharacterized protein n=1 Tax=Dermacentor silvarum TaxID=543639 RepID=A0ACB8DZZ6_DERSI|nr:hypothetical protein HPB49_011908 [Dermacentor silvarum]